MPITVRDGFLFLTSANDAGRIEHIKGSAILRMTTGYMNNRYDSTTLVTIGGNGFSLEVVEPADEIQEAITRSYKQVLR